MNRYTLAAMLLMGGEEWKAPKSVAEYPGPNSPRNPGRFLGRRWSPRTEPPLDAADQEKIDAAEAKRERRRAKRR